MAGVFSSCEDRRKEREERSKLLVLSFQTTKADFDKGFTFISTAFTLFTAASTALVGGTIALWDKQYGCAIDPTDIHSYIAFNYSIQTTTLYGFYTALTLALSGLFYIIIGAMTRQADLMCRMCEELVAQSPYGHEATPAAKMLKERQFSDRFQIKVAGTLLCIVRNAVVLTGVFCLQFFPQLLFCRDASGFVWKLTVAVVTTGVTIVVTSMLHPHVTARCERLQYCGVLRGSPYLLPCCTHAATPEHHDMLDSSERL